MASNSNGPRNQPVYDENGTPANGADMTQVAQFASDVGTRRADTSSERNALAGADLFDGLAFYETDTGALYVYNGGWSRVSSPLTSWAPRIGADTNPNLGTSGTATGFFSLNGKECTVWETFVFNGTGASSGSGNYVMTLPITASSALPFQPANGIADHAGASDPGASHGVIQGAILAGANTITDLRLGDGTHVSSSLAWATAGSFFAMQFTYLTA